MGPLGRLPAKKNLYAKQTETLWLIEVMYAIKRVLWIIGRLHAKIKNLWRGEGNQLLSLSKTD